MIICPNCNAQTPAEEEICATCGTQISYGLSTEGRTDHGGVSESAISSEQVVEEAATVREALEGLRRELESHQNGIAATLSVLLPGLGHIYRGRLSGLPIILAWVVGLPLYFRWCLSSYMGMTPAHYLVGALFGGLWLWSFAVNFVVE